MANCARCGTELRAGKSFCLKCGAPAGDSVNVAATNRPATPSASTSVGVEEILCPACGTSLRPGKNICRQCGAWVCARCGALLRQGAKFCHNCQQPVGAVTHIGSVVPRLPDGNSLIFNGRYQVIGELGRGGMGSVVYKVRDMQTGQVLALKEMDETQLGASGANSQDIPKIVEAFRREARLLKHLDHPNAVKVYEYFQIGLKHYMAMDCVNGRPLDKILESSSGGFPEQRVLPWAVQLCDVLDHLHNQNPPIIYRDLKPGNVMIQNSAANMPGEQVKLIDFGIAREFKGNKKQGDTVKMGTPGYAAPEASFHETGPAADVYSLGVMLYQLLTGIDPTDEANRSISNDPTRPPFFAKSRLLRPPVSASPRVADAIDNAVKLDMQGRTQTMALFSEALTGKKPPAQAQVGTSQQEPVTSQPVKLPASQTSLPQSSATNPPACVQVAPLQVDAGTVEQDAASPVHRSFEIVRSGRGRAAIQVQEPWLTVSPVSAANGERVTVSIYPDRLPLEHLDWRPPQFLAAWLKQPLFWLLIIGAAMGGLWWTLLWQALVLLGGGAAGVQLALWTISGLLRSLVRRPTSYQGHIQVSDSVTSDRVTVNITVAPPAWRQMVGWAAVILPTLAEVGAVSSLLWWLMVWLETVL